MKANNKRELLWGALWFVGVPIIIVWLWGGRL